MARNGSGVYTVPNTFSSGSTISSADHNENFDDLGDEITNSLAADGQTSMTGPLKAANGSVSAPALTFAADTDTGIYRSSANSVGLAAGGSLIAEATPDGLRVSTTANFTAPALFAGTVGVTGALVASATANFVVGFIASATANFSTGFIASATCTFADAIIASATATFTTQVLVAGSPAVKQSDVAAQSDMEAASSTTKYVSPGRVTYHPGAAKAWVKFAGSNGAISASHNVSSVTKNATGDYTVNLSITFSSSNYCAVGSCDAQRLLEIGTQATTSCGVITRIPGSTSADATNIYVAFFGDI